MKSSGERKASSEEYLQKLDIPVNPYLPRIEDESEAKLREPREVAERCIVLYTLVAIVHGIDREWMIRWLEDEKLWHTASPKEIIFFQNQEPSERDLAYAHWRIEAIWVMLWALRKVEKLSLPTSECNVEMLRSILPKLGESIHAFISSASLRSLSEILDATDLIYRIHWAVRDSQLNFQSTPAQLNPDVVIERHYALNWLTFYAENWDDVTTDT